MVTYEYSCQSHEEALKLEHSTKSPLARLLIGDAPVSLNAKQLRILARDALVVSLALEELPPTVEDRNPGC